MLRGLWGLAWLEIKIFLREPLGAIGGIAVPVVAFLIMSHVGGPRLADSLADMAEVLGPRPAVVARELTKLYEECVRGTLAGLAADPRCQAPKGEIVVVVGPGEQETGSEADADAALAEALTRLPPGEAAAEVSKALNLPRKPLYKRALELQGR